MRDKQPPEMIHIGNLLSRIRTIKIICENEKCKSPIGVYVFNEYVMHDRIICKSCGWDNAGQYDGQSVSKRT
jgi:hypothetical protein